MDRGNPGILAVKVDALSRPAVEQTRRLWFGIHIGEFWFGSEPGGFAARDAAKAEQLTRTLDFPSELSVWEKGVELITRIRRVAEILPTTCGLAQTLADRDKITHDKVDWLNAKRVNSNCGTHIQFSIDYASYQGATAGPSVRKQSPTEYLMNAGDAMINVCKSEAGKAAVAAKIKEVHGAYTQAEEEPLAGGVFTYRVGYKGGSVDHPEKF